jgi:hypothetical protein
MAEVAPTTQTKITRKVMIVKCKMIEYYQNCKANYYKFLEQD